MMEEEKELSAFTPSMPPPPPDLPGVAPEAVDFVKKQIADNEVVVWSLKYNEFCWTLISFLDRPQVPYTKIGISSFEYAKDQMGNKHQAAHLGEKTSEIQLIMAFLTRNRRNFRLNCQFSTFHVTIRLYK